MKLFQKALDKAKEEGKIDSRIIPWERSLPIDDNTSADREEPCIPFQLMKFSDEVLDDFQKVIESIRSLADSGAQRVIGFTSVIPHQGNSTIMALLSLLMAGSENGRFEPAVNQPFQGAGDRSNILLIDAQMRHASVHRMFEVKVEGGLSELLGNELSFDQVLREVETSHLKLITAGEKKNFRYNQVILDRFKSFLNEVKTQFEFVFVDIPPLLQSADGIAVSKLCDSVVLVVNADGTRLELIQEAKRLLERAGVHILGGVLNRRMYHIPGWLYKRL